MIDLDEKRIKLILLGIPVGIVIVCILSLIYFWLNPITAGTDNFISTWEISRRQDQVGLVLTSILVSIVSILLIYITKLKRGDTPEPGPPPESESQ